MQESLYLPCGIKSYRGSHIVIRDLFDLHSIRDSKVIETTFDCRNMSLEG